VLGSREPLLEEGPLCVLASILLATPVVLSVGSDDLEDLPPPKPNKSEKSTAFSFPLFFGGLLFSRVVPADCERAIGSGGSIRRDFTSEVSIAGDEDLLSLLAVVIVSRGRIELNFDTPGALAGLEVVVDLRAFAVAGVIVASLSTEIGRLR